MSKIHPTAIIAESAVIGPDCEIGPYVIIEDDVVLGARNKIWPHAFIGQYTTIGDDNKIHPSAVIGHLPQDLKFDPKTKTETIIGNGNTFREHSSVHRATVEGGKTIVGNNNLFMANTHVAHDCLVGNNIIMVNNASIPGHCEVGDNAIMSGMTGIHQFCRIGRFAMVSALSAANKDLPPFFIYGGRPAVSQGVNVVGLKRNGISLEARKEIRQAYKWIYREQRTITEALEMIENNLHTAEAKELAEFIRTSKRGICMGANEVEDTLLNRRKTGRMRHGLSEKEVSEATATTEQASE